MMIPIKLIPTRWIPLSESITIGGRNVPGPVYVIDPPNGHANRIAAIDPSLPIDDGSPEPWTGNPSDLAYYGFSPRQRGRFVTLHAERGLALSSDSFARPYSRLAFGMVERRVLLENDHDPNLLFFLHGLLQRFPQAAAEEGLAACLTQLIHLVACRSKGDYMRWLQWLNGLAGLIWGEADIKLMLAKFFEVDSPVPASFMFRVIWLQADPSLRNSISLNWPAFWNRYEFLFQQKYSAGFPLGRPRDPWSWCYFPVHPATRIEVFRGLPDAPYRGLDFLKDPAQFAPLLELAKTAAQEAEPRVGVAQTTATTNTTVSADAQEPSAPAATDIGFDASQNVNVRESDTFYSPGDPHDGEFFDGFVVTNGSNSVASVSLEEHLEIKHEHELEEVVEKTSEEVDEEPSLASPGSAPAIENEQLITPAALAEARGKQAALENMLRELVGANIIPETITPLEPDARSEFLNKLTIGQALPELAPLLHVGRKDEIAALAGEVARVANGHSAVRVIPAPSGSGKTLLLNLLSRIAHRSNVLVSIVDISVCPSIRLASGSEGFQDLVSKAMTGLQFPGHATIGGLKQVLDSIAKRFSEREVKRRKPEQHQDRFVEAILDVAPELSQIPLGFDVARVAANYIGGTDRLLSLRWFSAGNLSPAERKQLGVKTDLYSGDLLDFLKVVTALATLADLGGCVLVLDEFSIIINSSPNKAERQANYNALLGLLNAHGLGHLHRLGVILAGTEDIMDPRRGLPSCEALKTRLQSPNTPPGSAPVIPLSRLTPAEIVVLLGKVRDLALADDLRARLPDEALIAFTSERLSTLAAREHATPRDILKAFVAGIGTLLHDPEWQWQKHWTTTQ